MKRLIAGVFTFVSIIGTSQAYAQGTTPGAGQVQLSVIPAGGVFFTERTESSKPGFGNYGLGGALTFNVNRFVGLEAEVIAGLGITQELKSAGITADVKTPHLLNYSGNIVLSAPNSSSVVPYLTGGVGGLTLFKTTRLGITEAETFLTGNAGAGLKWSAGRWGLRADYRFQVVRAKDDATDFFGQERRYGHRVYAGVTVNILQ